MHRFILHCALAVLFFSFFLAPAAKACSPDPSPPQTVCGYLSDLISTGGSGMTLRTPQQRYMVMLCRVGGSCNTTQSIHTNDGREAYNFPWYMLDGSYNSYVYYAYVWSDYEYWGSSMKPLASVNVFQRGLLDLNFNVAPRPLPPNTIYPNNGNTSVLDHYLVQWYSGLDPQRQNTSWPATWEVWYKYWPFDGSEPASWSLARADMPCHDDGSGPDVSGNCSTYVAGPQPPGNWRWFVRADMDVSRSLYTNFGTTIFSTDSFPAWFQEP
jgi:hypothetical protein